MAPKKKQSTSEKEVALQAPVPKPSPSKLIEQLENVSNSDLDESELQFGSLLEETTTQGYQPKDCSIEAIDTIIKTSLAGPVQHLKLPPKYTVDPPLAASTPSPSPPLPAQPPPAIPPPPVAPTPDKGKRPMLPSGSSPLMTYEEMSKQTAASSTQLGTPSAMTPVMTAAEYTAQTARDLVNEWSVSVKRSLTREEKECLATVIMSGIFDTTADFDKILLGFKLRGEHNINECRNVLTAMQELQGTMAASQREFQTMAKRLIDGMHASAIKTAVQAPTTLITPTAQPLSIAAGKPKVEPSSSGSRTGGNASLSIKHLVDDEESSKPATIEEEEEEERDESGLVTMGEFLEAMNRDLSYMERVLKGLNPTTVIGEYINGQNITHKKLQASKKDVWNGFVSVVKGLQSQIGKKK